MVTIRISEECGDVLRKLAEKARRSLCKQVEAMIMSQNDIDEYEQAWNDAKTGRNLTFTGKFTSFENALEKLGINDE